MTRVVRCPKQTRGWQVRDHSDGDRTWIDASGQAYRSMRQVEGTSPDVRLRYTFTDRETWLRRLGPRQAKERLG